MTALGGIAEYERSSLDEIRKELNNTYLHITQNPIANINFNQILSYAESCQKYLMEMKNKGRTERTRYTLNKIISSKLLKVQIRKIRQLIKLNENFEPKQMISRIGLLEEKIKQGRLEVMNERGIKKSTGVYYPSEKVLWFKVVKETIPELINYIDSWKNFDNNLIDICNLINGKR